MHFNKWYKSVLSKVSLFPVLMQLYQNKKYVYLFTFCRTLLQKRFLSTWKYRPISLKLIQYRLVCLNVSFLYNKELSATFRIYNERLLYLSPKQGSKFMSVYFLRIRIFEQKGTLTETLSKYYVRRAKI